MNARENAAAAIAALNDALATGTVRDAYDHVMSASHAVHRIVETFVEQREQDRIVRLKLNPDVRAEPWDTSEVRDDGTCRRCGGTGAFITGTVNGRPTGPGGICFRCDGKGYQTRRDVARNDYRDEHQSV